MRGRLWRRCGLWRRFDLLSTIRNFARSCLHIYTRVQHESTKFMGQGLLHWCCCIASFESHWAVWQGFALWSLRRRLRLWLWLCGGPWMFCSKFRDAQCETAGSRVRHESQLSICQGLLLWHVVSTLRGYNRKIWGCSWKVQGVSLGQQRESTEKV